MARDKKDHQVHLVVKVVKEDQVVVVLKDIEVC